MILKSASRSRSLVLGSSKRVCCSAGRNVRVDELGPLRSVFLTLHAHLFASAEKWREL
jgi:hypothetical protein